MIPILCYSCSTHLANTDVARLEWPLDGAMFDVIYPGWFLRPGPLNLDLFCPACGAFPFSHDPYVAGGNAVGKNLNVRGADGKPVVMTVKQILMVHGPKESPTGTDLMRMLSPYQREKYQMDFKTCLPICPDCGEWCLSLEECKAYQEIKDNDSREPAPLSQGNLSEPAQNHIPVCESEGGGPEKPHQSEAISSRAGHGQSTSQDQHPGRPLGDDSGVLGGQKASPGGKPAFPCPHCGAKKRFHKKGCMLGLIKKSDAVLEAKMSEDLAKDMFVSLSPEPLPGHLKEQERYRQWREKNPDPAGRLPYISERVSSGPETGNEPVTPADIAELERERAAKQPSKRTDDLRPAGGR